MKRSIKKPMGELGFHFVGIFLAILCLFLTGFSEGNRRISEEASSGNGGRWTHQETDENTAEQVWVYCKKELGEIAKTMNGFNLYSDNNPKHDVASSRKTLVHNPVTDLPPQLKRSLLLSLKSKRSQSRVSGSDGCEECLSKLYGHNIHPRKTIKRRHYQQRRRSRHRSLGSAQKEPSPAPTNSPETSHKRLSQKLEIEHKLRPKKKPPDHVLLIGIIVSTSVATLSLFVLLLICCVGGNESRVAMSAQEDEKPVINKCPGNKDSINSCNTNNLSANAACQTPEGGDLPLPPGKTAPPPEPPPPAAPKAPPPPPPIGARPPDPPKLGNLKRPPGPPPPVGLHNHGRSSSGDEKDRSRSSNSLKTKLKPFFWDKMNASPNQSMVWHGIKEGSFQFDEEMMESLFGYANSQSKGDRGKSTSNLNPRSKFIQIIDPRKAQNLAILLKALNVTTEKVCTALKEGNELPVVLISTLIKMAPTQEEELKLRLYNGDLDLLGPAERFLKVVVEIPFVFKRFEALLFMSSLQEESSSLRDAFATLEVQCLLLSIASRLFLKLLEAVLKTGNRMNVGTHRGGAQAIKLDSLLKLSDVKGTDGQTTLLSFVVQEIIRSEGIKAARARAPSGSSSTVNTNDLQKEPTERSPEYYRKLGLEVVSRLSDELEDVKKAAVIDGDNITSTVLKLGTMFKKTKDLINNELSSEATEFCNALHGFMEHAESEIIWMLEEEKRIMTLVKSTGDYFHGNSGKDEGLRLFTIVRDFLKLLDGVCINIKKTAETNSKKKDDTPAGKTKPSVEENDPRSAQNIHEKLFPAIKDRQMDYSSSDDEDMSP
ncbi:Actin-binding FH2 [Cynara cardunculus var. scolymus]|uniref:Formin-like protein n=1 Tax=Cynara cardunculus var. scolymus TaxID=59895 RepID=A0A118K2D2_CYNCS|nr:Actin-binding FH2 [Cynara cardunculus var. scolymus]